MLVWQILDGGILSALHRVINKENKNMNIENTDINIENTDKNIENTS